MNPLILVFSLIAFLAVVSVHTRAEHAAETAAAWIVANPNYDPAVGR